MIEFITTQLTDPRSIAVVLTALLLGLVLGAVLSKISSTKRAELLATQLRESFSQQEGFLQQQLNESKLTLHNNVSELLHMRAQQLETQNKLGQLSQQVERIPKIEQDSLQWRQQYQQSQQLVADLRTQLGSQAARFEQEQVASQDKLALLESAEIRLQQQFENLANRIFEQKNENFRVSSKAGLDALLNPLKDQIEGFKKQVTEQYVKEGQERASLKTEIMGLKELNQQITHDAAALTKALKGDNKKQGNWGEVVLERVLKESGLREGHEFDTQVSLKNEAGKNYQP
ncbi:MAG: DNA recombination protein RmuC, partial [Paraglaciecola sp.]